MSFLEKYADRIVDFTPNHINHYLKDGAAKVCDIALELDGTWRYTNIDQDLMYADHRSWIYFIVVNGEVYKVGETGNPLGIRKRASDQPYKGTTCRLGRYSHRIETGDTDYVIRCDLAKQVKKGLVSIWAIKCPILQTPITIGGFEEFAHTTIHKDLELKYLDYMSSYGFWPKGNKHRK